MVPLAYEVNFDGIVGQTHNYSGLSFGNTASMDSKDTTSYPKLAALQGLEKMKLLHDLGIKQGVLPPHERPHIPTLRRLGFSGTDRSLPEKAYQVDPLLLTIVSSASPMWAANAATFSPRIDCPDNKIHIIPANLFTMPHRSIEADFTSRVLKAIFPSTAFFKHHPPLPGNKFFKDEGSANHTRFCREYSEMGVHLFTYGMHTLADWNVKPEKFPARQTLEASEAVARCLNIYPERIIFAQQSPAAIDAGAFHNDVISVGDRNLFMYHEEAFENTETVISEISNKVQEICETRMQFIKVPAAKIPLNTAIKTYLFNSQLITMPDKTYTLIAPQECRRNPSVSAFLEEQIKDPDSPLHDVQYIDIRESMRNGGGPACLRTRVTLTQEEYNALNPKCLFSDRLYSRLQEWIEKHYRDELKTEDLKDPILVDETQTALHELSIILDLGHIYSFQT